MVEFLKRSWAVVNLDHIDHNINSIKTLLSDNCMLMGVVKADAYGHGDKYIADELVRLGVNFFGVSNLNEAISLRHQGIFHPILILGPSPVEVVSSLNEYNLTQTVHSLEYAQSLQEAAAYADVKLQIHVKVDTGMSRIGFVTINGGMACAKEQIKTVYHLPNLVCEGIFTHFAVADDPDGDNGGYTRAQYARFEKLIGELIQEGCNFRLKHCCNSAATLNYPEMHLDMVRPGILLYGMLPSGGCSGKIDLKPAMELYSTVTMVKTIQAGTSVSYGRTFTAEEDTVVATVPIGYADGYDRILSNRARMIVNGHYARVIGNICMDQLMLDVTGIPEVKTGDIVTIVGKQGDCEVTFDELAALSGSINYEKICVIGKRVPRIYRHHGKDVGMVDYVMNKVHESMT